METITEGSNNSGGDPQITTADESAFDTLANEVFGGDSGGTEKPIEKKPEPAPNVETQTQEKPAEQTGEQKPAEGQQQGSTQVTPTPKLEEKPAAQQAAPDKELEAIHPPRGLSHKSLEGWNALKSVAAQRGTQLAAAEAKVKELESKVGQVDPELQKKYGTLEQELAQYKAIYQNERSPEFLEKYDKPITQNEDKAFDILKRQGLDEKSINQIKRIGLANVEPAVMTRWLDAINKVNVEDGEGLKNAYLKNRELSKERESKLEEIKKAPGEFEAKQREASTQSFQQYTKSMQEHANTMVKDVPWARMQEIPKDATPEQRAAIEADNKFYQESEARFQQSLFPKSAQDRVNVALGYCLSFRLANDLGAMQEQAVHWKGQADQLQKQLDEIKAAGRINGGGNLPQGSNGKKQVDRSAMNDDDAIEAGLKEVGA